MSASLYQCDGCNETILPRKARIHCDECIGNHNVCANCYVVGNYTQRHREDHSIMLNEMSGYMPRPPPIPPRAQAAPSRRPVGGKHAVSPPSVQPPMGRPPPGPPPQDQTPPYKYQQPPIPSPYYTQPRPSPGPPSQESTSSPSWYQQPPAFSQRNVQQSFPERPVLASTMSPVHISQTSLEHQSQSTSPQLVQPPTHIVMVDNSQLYSATPPLPERPAAFPSTEPKPRLSPPVNEQPQIPRSVAGLPSGSPLDLQNFSIPSTVDQSLSGIALLPSHEGGYEQLQSPLPGPPPGPPPPSQHPRISPAKSAPGPPSISQRSSLSQPPVVTLQEKPQSAVQSGWQPLFQGSSPTPIMVAFLQAVFSCLDTDRDGLLTPEQYSAFLDVQGYGPDEDVWKKSHKDLPGFTADDVADFELKSSYENWSIQHNMVARPNAKTSSYIDNMIDSMPFDASFAKLMKDKAERKTFSGGMMPMITLQGFIDITVIETVSDPSPGWIRVNRMAQNYNIWREWGDVPRSMMPNVAPADLVTRIAIVTQQARAKAQTMVDASAAEAAIKAQGRENALRLFDPPGTRYVYRY